MKNLNLIIAIMLLGTNVYGQRTFNSIPKIAEEGLGIGPSRQLILLDNQTFQFELRLRGIYQQSTGIWEMTGDSIVLNSNRKPGAYLPQIAQIEEFKDGCSHVKVCFQDYLDETNENITYTMGINELSVSVYSKGKEIFCVTDSSGNCEFNGITQIDSVKIGELNGNREWMIYPNERNVNRMIVRINLWDLVIEGLEEPTWRYFQNEKWLMKDNSIFDPKNQVLYELTNNGR